MGIGFPVFLLLSIAALLAVKLCSFKASIGSWESVHGSIPRTCTQLRDYLSKLGFFVSHCHFCNGPSGVHRSFLLMVFPHLDP